MSQGIHLRCRVCGDDLPEGAGLVCAECQCPHPRESRMRVIDKLGPMLDYGTSAMAQVMESHVFCRDCGQTTEVNGVSVDG